MSEAIERDSMPALSLGIPIVNRARTDGTVVTYEQRLSSDLRWAMEEGDRYFRGEGGAHDALRRITKRLNELGIPYAVAGGLALFSHGFRRFTDDVDILVTRADLDRIHDELEGRGYLRPFSKSKNLRDTELGVKIEFLVSGQYPGDGKPKPIAFPSPTDVLVEKDGIKYINLPTLVSLKLASGMTGTGRSKDIGDVEELIKTLGLPDKLADSLHPFVQEKYREIWAKLHQRPKRYATLWRNKWLTAEAKSLDDMIAALRQAAAELEAMRRDGIVLDPESGVGDDYADLITTDPEVARKYDMQPEEEPEYWSEEGDEPMGEDESHSTDG
jgi:hypothetical protein